MQRREIDQCDLGDWVKLEVVEFHNGLDWNWQDNSPRQWTTPAGATWSFAPVEMPLQMKGEGHGTDFGWMRYDPADGVPSRRQDRQPDSAMFKDADWWKSEREPLP